MTDRCRSLQQCRYDNCRGGRGGIWLWGGVLGGGGGRRNFWDISGKFPGNSGSVPWYLKHCTVTRQLKIFDTMNSMIILDSQVEYLENVNCDQKISFLPTSFRCLRDCPLPPRCYTYCGSLLYLADGELRSTLLLTITHIENHTLNIKFTPWTLSSGV